jgi:hypothetical protein
MRRRLVVADALGERYTLRQRAVRRVLGYLFLCRRFHRAGPGCHRQANRRGRGKKQRPCRESPDEACQGRIRGMSPSRIVESRHDTPLMVVHLSALGLVSGGANRLARLMSAGTTRFPCCTRSALNGLRPRGGPNEWATYYNLLSREIKKKNGLF